MGMTRAGCPVATALTAGEYGRLADLEGTDELEWFTWCELEGGHEDPWHWAHAQTALDGVWWLRWQPTARELVTHLACQADTEKPDQKEPEPCTLPEGHIGRHSFDFSIPEDRFGPRHPALTVGELRRALEDLDDDTPIRIGATGEGILPEDIECLLAGTALGRVRAMSPDSAYMMPRDALVLLAGLSVRSGHTT
jgi:hypothetical protein